MSTPGGAVLRATSMVERRPDGNVLFITMDQLRADVLFGALGRAVALPNFDRLRARSAEFVNCWTAAVPCGPSRASLLTGLFAFNHRAIRNGTPMARHHATLATELRHLGREPLLFGYCDIAADPTGRDPADPDFRTYELPAAGFTTLAAFPMEAPVDWIGHLRGRGYALPGPQPQNWPQLFRPVGDGLRAPPIYAAEDSDTAWLTDQALTALEGRRDSPWTAHLTYLRPHPPLVAPAPYNHLVAAADVPPPAPPPSSDHPFRRAWFSAPSAFDLHWGFDGDCAALAPQDVQTLRALYLGLVAELDHHLCRLLDWLAATGQDERTLIVLAADHGEMLGDQGYWGKDNVLAPAHHVPLLIAAPGGRPGQRTGIARSIDIAPTILDWLGGRAPPAMDGASLLPSLADPGAPLADHALTEIDLALPHRQTRFQRALNLPEAQANAAILRDARWTYVHFNGGLPPLLFDRQADPGERHDLTADPAAAAQISRLRAALIDLRMTRADRRLTGHSFGIA
ncbi:sulfatase-like hydrolase/transferase [Pararhodobacter sp. SW119]|uniref:sulfatase-like hydrolase/transferase n=1 Tax=Pararhodobacter sp. SW119 TaxID=2780075 RepID=UPI001ADEDFDB|nr:sulfatase-like hydrolase/transferase [Pararhodobacter sp. SW119]